MSDDTTTEREDQHKDDPEVGEVVSDFGDVRVRSGFEIKEQEPGVLSVNIFGPFIEFLNEDDEADEDDES